MAFLWRFSQKYGVQLANFVVYTVFNTQYSLSKVFKDCEF